MTKRNAMSRKEAIIATILLVIFGTSMHFVHHLPFFNHFWGYIFPVTESVMAHMKMNFYPMLLFAIYLVISRRDIKEFGTYKAEVKLYTGISANIDVQVSEA